MVVIAVAGGTGGVGKAIVEALTARGKHEIKVLARKANPDFEAQYGVPILVVDYEDVKAVTKTLEDNNVHTIVSSIAMLTFDNSTPGEFALIEAADASKPTKRYLTSDWGTPTTPELAAVFSGAAAKLKAQAQLRKTGLEWTAFHTGYFLDYYGTLPGVKSHMTPLTNVLDTVNNVAGIPATGNTPVAFTHTSDVAKYVAASVDQPKWNEATTVIGDKVTWNEFLRLAEEAKGTKFRVEYTSVEDLKSGKVAELPSHVPLYSFVPKEHLQGLLAMFGLWFEEGVFDLHPAKLFNDEVPEIKPYTVKAFLNEAWGKKA